jgi:hypothetical protein
MRRVVDTNRSGQNSTGRSLKMTGVCEIVPDLEGLAFPVERLTPLPGNPRQGDVQAVARSYATFGQRKPIVARREGKRRDRDRRQPSARRSEGAGLGEDRGGVG